MVVEKGLVIVTYYVQIGAVGSQVVEQLLQLESVEKITLLLRKPTDKFKHAKVAQVIVNFDKLGFEFEEKKDLLRDHSVIISCLGTTKSASANATEYRRVEVEYPRDFARLAKAIGAKHALLISSDGANPGSMVTYLAQKGEVEEEWKKLNFDTLTIYRPGLLERGDKKTTMEKLFGIFTKPIPCETVAKAVKTRVRDIIAQDTKEVKEVVWRNPEIMTESERLPPVDLIQTSEGVDASSSSKR